MKGLNLNFGLVFLLILYFKTLKENLRVATHLGLLQMELKFLLTFLNQILNYKNLKPKNK